MTEEEKREMRKFIKEEIERLLGRTVVQIKEYLIAQIRN